MLDFSPEYFEPEVRDGYFISEKMKRFRAASLEVLNLINSIADEYGLTVYIDFGALLGTVRHGGFIPWDDDIDVSMLRDEYNQFLRILPDALPGGYMIYDHSGKNVPRDTKSFVSNSAGIEDSSEFLRVYHGCPFLTGLDIFPIDTVPDDEEFWNTQKLLFNAVYDAAERFDTYRAEGSLEGYLESIEELLNVEINRSGDIRSQLWILADRLASLAGADEGDRVAYMADIITGGDGKMRPKSWYKTSVLLDYENIKVHAPAGYNFILKSIYGDYMRAVRGSARHDYPVYKKMDPDDRYLERKYKRPEDLTRISRDDFSEGRVLFLIRKASGWKYFKGLFEKEKAAGCDVKVIALPFKYRDEFQNAAGEWISQAELLPDGLPVVSPQEYNIEKELPERVYIQDPFDSYSLATEITSDYFAERIREYTKELVFVLPFEPALKGADDEMSKEMFRGYVNTPGMLLADRIVLQDDKAEDFFRSFEGLKDKRFDRLYISE